MSRRFERCTGSWLMSDEGDWKLATWDGQRRLQMEEFHALPFAEKMRIIEEMADLAREFAARRLARATAMPLPLL